MESNYATHPLGKLVDVKGGKRLPKGHLYSKEPTNHPYLRVCDFISDSIDESDLKFIDQETYSKISRYTISDDDVYISIAGTIGLTGVVPKHLSGANLTENAAKLVIKDKNILYKHYLSLYLATEGQKEITKKVKTTSQPKLALFRIKEILIPLPSLEEQKRIAAILDKADEVRRKREEAIRLTEELARSRFLDMFGDPVTNPKGWGSQKLEDFSLIQSGIAKGKKIDASQAINLPYIRVANVQDGYLNLSEIKELLISRKDVYRYTLLEGDLLLTEGGDPDKLGRGAVWYGQVQPCIHQNHIFAVRPNSKLAEPEYLSALIGSELGKNYFLRAAKQTTGIATINKTQLRNFPALLPPLELQKEYTKFVMSVRVKQDHLNKISDESNKLFNSLLQRAFKGEL